MKQQINTPCLASFFVRRIQAFLLAMLMCPMLAIAAGAEDTEYIGLAQNNKLLRIRFAGDPAEWTKGNFIYGAADYAAFKYCWRESAAAQNTQSAAGTKSPAAFNCTRRKGENFSISYFSVEANAETKQIFARIAHRARLGNDTRRGDGSLTRIYECKIGCAGASPRFIFEVTHYD